MYKYLNISVLIVSIVCYGAVWISPATWWVAGYLAYGIPIVLLVNIILLISGIKNLRKRVIFPAIALLIGFDFIMDTFQVNPKQSESSFKVLSYNTHVFNIYGKSGENDASVTKMIDWINQQKADIICLQEFYNHNDSRHYNTLEKIRGSGNYQYYHIPIVRSSSGGEFGQVIFSRYPIINKGVINFMKNTKNFVIYADLLIDDDTLRIYNMHLQSMHINENDMINADDIETGFKYLTDRLSSGFVSRASQVKMLMESLRQCPYEIILCGDLNDPPYSYVYHQLSGLLRNSFREAGRGFGFTYNGKLFFLRIDNQFFSDKLNVNSFDTHHELKYSDHFPITASYTLVK